MHSWNEGYHTDTNYSAGYFPQLNPLYVKHMFTLMHKAFPKIDENFTACELGFGQGVSVVLHGASSPGKWYGTDFNPNQVNFAQNLAKHANFSIHLSDDAFGDYANRDDVPMLDYIGVHGIWSWISPTNQQSIVEFAKKKLKVGGVLYLSYNVGPNFTFFEPIRQIMYDYLQTCAIPAATQESQVPKIIELIDKLMSFKRGHATPMIQERVNSALHNPGLSHNYLCHEYLNDDWDVSSFKEVSRRLDQAKLSYVCQHPFYLNIDNFVAKPEEMGIVNRFRNTGEFYQTIKDYVSSEQFRTDYFARGVRKLSDKEYRDELNNLCYVMVADGENLDEVAFDSRHGRATLDPRNWKAVVEILKDHRVYSFKDLSDKLVNNKQRKIKNADGKDFTNEDLVNTLIFLLCSSLVAPAVKENTISKEIIKRCKDINRAIISTEVGTEVVNIVSPVTQCGFMIDDVTRMILALYQMRPDVTEKEAFEAFKPMIFSQELKLFDKDRKQLTEKSEIEKTFKKNVHNTFHNVIPTYRKLHIL